MPTDHSPLKPPEDDPSQQTLDSQSTIPAPVISCDDQTSRTPRPLQPAPPQSAFSPGDTIAKRFRILRFIARGGMGEVYEALDIELKQKVALKTVRSVLLADVQSLERFRQEIVVAKRITHPNVCRTYDLFRHETSDDPSNDVLVVSMELLAGQTLDHLLKEKGKLTTAEALPPVKQMIAGLAAAHEAGVVHRDFKSNNVMLVAPPSGSGATRVVVTDFGLAHSLEGGEFALTRTGEMLGTPSYMAPEQVTGKEITPATDIYSLGIVMFEMVTGRLPFSGKNWRELAFARLEQAPPSPKGLQPDLDDVWSLAIQKCMQLVPADRYTSVTDVEKALVGQIETVLPKPPNKLKRLLVASAAALLLAAVGVFIGIEFPNLLPWRESPSVTVLGFKNISGDSAFDTWGDQFRTNLGTTLDVKPIRYVTPRDMGGFWKPQSPSEMSEEPSPDFLTKLHKHGCRYAVYGTYMVVSAVGGHKILWNIRLIDTKTGQSLGSVTRNPTESELTDIVSGAGEEVREKLGVSLSAADKRGTDRALPANPQASQAYAAGKSALDNFEYASARDSFVEAVAADPNNAEIRSALAEALWKLGFETKASEEAKTAAGQAADLTNETRGLIQARSLEYSGQWDQAAKLYESLWNLSDNNYQFALLLASSRISGKHYQDAVSTLQSLSGGKVPDIVKAQRDLYLADALQKLGNNPERLKAAESAVTLAESLGGGLLQARAEIARCLALLDLGKMEQARKVCADGVDLSEKQADDLGTARAKNSVANGYFMSGDLDKAQPLYEQALAIATRIGDKRDQAGALLNLGNIQYYKNNFPAARKAYEQSVQISTERSGINDDLMAAKLGLALVFVAQGQLSPAISQLREVVEAATSVGDKTNLAVALVNLCDAQLSNGDVAGARSSCQQSLALMNETGDKAGAAASQKSLADVLLASGDLSAANSYYQQALKTQQSLGAEHDAAMTRFSLVNLSLEQKDYPTAEKLAQSLLDSSLSQKDTTSEVSARCLLVRAYLGLGRRQDAVQQMQKAKEHEHELQDGSAIATLAIQQARVQNTPKPSDSATTDLKKMETDMRKSGFLHLALEAKFARAEALTGPARKAELKSIADEAKQHGFLLLARKASAA
jgi:serine/threonine protein kinase/tetratricopeptide (TPR) repeat protein